MGRARQIASAENMDRILLDASAASTDEGEHLLLDASASGTDVGFFINTEIGTTEVPPEGFVIESSLASNAVTNSKIATDAVTVTEMDSTSQSLSNRNTIINGAFNVNQRGNQTGAGASNVYLADRFFIDVNSAARFNSTTPDVTDLPGFTKCLKIDCTTADTSVASGDLFMLRSTFEGQDVQHYKKGTSEAQGWVLSYYIKVDGGPFTGTAELNDSQNGRHVNANFTATNTWQRISHFFPADTSGTLDNDNTDTLRVNWHFMAGSTFSGGSIQSAWASRSNSNTAPGTDNFFSSTDNNIYLTGIQLEAGDTLTAFENEPVERTLTKCQRYYEEIKVVASTNSLCGPVAVGQDISGRKCIGPYVYKTEKRAAPTIANVTIGIDAGDTTHSFVFSTGTHTTSESSTTATDIGEADGLENSFDIVIDADF